VSEREEASPSELAKEIGASLATVSYHMRKLAELELIELVRTTPRRGATEHHYRALGYTYFRDETLSDLPRALRDSLVQSWWTRLVDDVAAGLATHGWDRPEAQGLRASLKLDKEAWRELSEEIDALYRRALELEAESKLRHTETPAGISAVVALLLFERPATEPEGT
jgi:DNA-binding transcriptional ArsR family regulator